MSTPANQRVCSFKYPDHRAWCEITIVNNYFVIVSSANMTATGLHCDFELIVQKSDGRDDEYFGCLIAGKDIRVQLSLTPEEAEEIHAAIPEIKFIDTRVEVQP